MSFDIGQARKALEDGDFVEAEAIAERLLGDGVNAEQKTECLYTLGVAQRYQGKFARAIRTQARLIEHNPDFARVYQERGHTLLSRNDLPNAQRAYEKAVNLNPALVASWKALLNLYDLHDTQLNAQVQRHQQRAKQALEYLLGPSSRAGYR